MYVGSLPDTSNRQDWRLAMQLIDAATDEVVDIQDTTLTMTLSRKGEKLIIGSTTGGEITIDEDNVFSWFFPKARMSNLCQGQYDVGIRMTSVTDSTSQLVIAILTVLEGVDNQ